MSVTSAKSAKSERSWRRYIRRRRRYRRRQRVRADAVVGEDLDPQMVMRRRVKESVMSVVNVCCAIAVVMTRKAQRASVRRERMRMKRRKRKE